MTKWILSKYTAIIKSEDRGYILHNSFLGTVAHIPLEYTNIIDYFTVNGISEEDINIPSIAELRKNKFFVPNDIDEKAIINRMLEYEKNNSGFQVIILPHENCNFRCTYCYEIFERQKMKSDVIQGLKKFIENKSTATPHLQVSWFGGEPLLAKEVIYELSDSFMASCKQNGIQYTSAITTNGYFLSSDVFKELIKREVRSYQITLDGNESTHNMTRKLKGGGGTYNQILGNLINMRNSNEKFIVHIRVNYTDEIIKNIDKFLGEISEKFKGDPRFTMSFHPMGKWGGPNDESLNVCDPESAWLKKLHLIEKAYDSGMNIDVNEYLHPSNIACYAGKESSIVVRSDGKVCKCTVALEDPRNIVGKITKEGNMEIDQSLWNLWVGFDDKNNTKCQSCIFSPTCQSIACPLEAIDTKIPPCPFTKIEYESTIKLIGLKRHK